MKLTIQQAKSELKSWISQWKWVKRKYGALPRRVVFGGRNAKASANRFDRAFNIVRFGAINGFVKGAPNPDKSCRKIYRDFCRLSGVYMSKKI